MLSVACRRAVLVLVIAVPVMGMPVPASAAGEGDGGVSRQRPLAINGRPLARTITSAANGMLTLQIAAARVPPAIVLTRSQQGSSPNRSWVGRHPVLFGAIVGAVAGAAIVGATVHAEASFVGFYGGGAAGAVVGWFGGQ